MFPTDLLYGRMVADTIGDFTDPIFWDEPDYDLFEPQKKEWSVVIEKIYNTWKMIIGLNSIDPTTLKDR